MKFTNHPAFLAHQDALPIVFRQATFGLDTESTPISLLHLDHGLELDFGKATGIHLDNAFIDSLMGRMSSRQE
jgi:hypothetical protein